MEQRLKNNLDNRDKRLGKLDQYQERELKELLQEIQGEHQKLVANEAKAADEESREYYHRLCLRNEEQAQRVQQKLGNQYQAKAAVVQPKAAVVKNVLRAFLVGGLICVLGQLVINYVMLNYQLELKDAAGIASVIIVVLTALLTGFGIYDEIGRYGGAGSTVPISGFANSIASAAMEFRREGLIYGVGAKIFTIAGPVILYGTMASIAVGLIYYWMR